MRTRAPTTRIRPQFAARCGAIVLVAALATGVGAQTSSAPAPMNAMCPVMPDEPADPEFTLTYQGRTIGFCCERCREKFQANPERYAKRVPSLAGADEPPDTHDAAHREAAETDADPAHDGERFSEAHAHGEEEADAPAHAHGDDDARAHTASAAHADDHDHERDHGGAGSFVARLVAWLGKFHPPAVNFPIAMLAGAAMAEALLIVTRRAFFANAGRFCLWVGALGAVGGATLGWFLAGVDVASDSWLLATHRWLGTSTAVIAAAALFVGERAQRRAESSRAAFRVVLFLAAGLASATGFFGGAMIYGIRHYAW